AELLAMVQLVSVAVPSFDRPPPSPLKEALFARVQLVSVAVPSFDRPPPTPLKEALFARVQLVSVRFSALRIAPPLSIATEPWVRVRPLSATARDVLGSPSSMRKIREALLPSMVTPAAGPVIVTAALRVNSPDMMVIVRGVLNTEVSKRIVLGATGVF